MATQRFHCESSTGRPGFRVAAVRGQAKTRQRAEQLLAPRAAELEREHPPLFLQQRDHDRAVLARHFAVEKAAPGFFHLRRGVAAFPLLARGLPYETTTKTSNAK